MIRIKNLTVKNFLSIGNATQAVNFDREDLTLVLGENLDLGGDGSRNGCGKTTLLNALSFGLYGSALSDIKIGNLINKTNDKNMLVSVEFEIDGVDYRIERGRKPTVLKFYKNGEDLSKTDEAQGDSRETQKEITKLLGLSHEMFKHIVALNTYTIPFLSQRTADQKNIIEELLGITVLTEKAELLKIKSKETKDQIKEEEFRINATIKANEHIQEQISALKRRQKIWIKKKNEDIAELTSAIEKLMKVDIDEEINKHKFIAEEKERAKAEWYRLSEEKQKEYDEAMALYITEKEKVTQHNANIAKHNAEINECNKWLEKISKDNKIIEKRIKTLQKDIELLNDHKCHACGQPLHDTKQEENKSAKEKELQENIAQLLSNQTQENEHLEKLKKLGDPLELRKIPEPPQLEKVSPIKPNLPETFYSSLDEALEHKTSLDSLSKQLESLLKTEDPYDEQIKEMEETGLQEIDYSEINRLNELLEHQTFLLKLLTSKDSFVRKKIIEQNLAYLNSRLTYYLQEIGLPHNVRFMPDLSVEITDLGRELDFDNLSRGERNRLILSLSWAFRDVWESLYNHINLLFVDELVDNGLDTNGVEAAIKIMKNMARNRNKSVWLVSHRDELISRVHNIMKVIKENGFTSYEGSVE